MPLLAKQSMDAGMKFGAMMAVSYRTHNNIWVCVSRVPHPPFSSLLECCAHHHNHTMFATLSWLFGSIRGAIEICFLDFDQNHAISQGKDEAAMMEKMKDSMTEFQPQVQ
jgi:hypothetical protein